MTLFIDASNPDDLLPVQAAAAISLQQDLQILLLGDSGAITTALSHTSHNPTHIMVEHIDPGDDDALVAVMRHIHQTPQSTLLSSSPPHLVRRAARAALPLLPNCPREALCAIHPTPKTRGSHKDPFVLLLDVSDQLSPSADELTTFALMGATYSSLISNNPRPSIALLSPQSAIQDTPQVLLDVRDQLMQVPWLSLLETPTVFEVSQGHADVVVCPGYTGSLLAEILEDLPTMVLSLARSAQPQKGSRRARFTSNLKLKVLQQELDNIHTLHDHDSFGGTPLLGFPHTILLTHPDATIATFRRAAKLAGKCARLDLLGALQRNLAARSTFA